MVGVHLWRSQAQKVSALTLVSWGIVEARIMDTHNDRRRGIEARRVDQRRIGHLADAAHGGMALHEVLDR